MDIGNKIRLLRGNMSQADLASRTGIDKAIISKIESGKMPGTVASHEKIAEVFGMKLSQFYAYLENADYQPAQLHKAQEKTDTYKDIYEIITSIPLTKKMLPVIMTITSAEPQLLQETIKKVERFIFIIAGTVDIEIEGTVYRMAYSPSAGSDTLYSISPKQHTIHNRGSSPARLLCVSCPPVL